MVTFQDRVPTYPGRVTLTPVSGQANTYDMARADQPRVAGTPINKALFDALQAGAVQIAYGSYTGDGAKTRVWYFDFEPQAFMIYGTALGAGQGNSKSIWFFASKGASAYIMGDLSSSNNQYTGAFTWGANSVTIPTIDRTWHGPNINGYGYTYFAIGMPN